MLFGQVTLKFWQLSWALAHWASENEKLLAWRENLLVPENQTALLHVFSSFSYLAFFLTIEIISEWIFYWPCWPPPLCWLLELQCGIQHLSSQCCLPSEHSHLPFLNKTYNIKFYCIENPDLVTMTKYEKDWK